MGISTNTPERIQLGVGVVTIAGVDVGATSREGTFVVEQEIYWPDLGGSRGAIAGTGFVIKESALLTMTLKEFTILSLTYAIPHLAKSSDGTSEYTTLPTLGLIAEASHVTIEWAGSTAGGKGILIYLLRALPEPGITWTFSDDGEWEAEATWRCYYLKTSVTTRSWQVLIAT